MLAALIPEVLQLGTAASVESVDALARDLRLALPDEYRELLLEANGVRANLVTIYRCADVLERNAMYQVQTCTPGFILIGTANDFPLLVRGAPRSSVFLNDWGCPTSECLLALAGGLRCWVRGGCRSEADAPVCVACGRNFYQRYIDTGIGGASVRFADYVPPPEPPGERLPEIATPPGAKWFCALHLEEARGHASESSEQVIGAMQARFSSDEHPTTAVPSPAPTIQIAAAGPRRVAVAAVVRRITGCAVSEALDAVRSGTVSLPGPHPQPQRWCRELEDAGAVATIRYNDGLDELTG